MSDLERAIRYFRDMADTATQTGDPAARWWAALADELDDYLHEPTDDEGLFT